MMFTLTEIYEKFDLCKSWEERYRLLIQLSRQLPKLSESELAQLPEIHGCESRLWFQFELNPRKVTAYSDARLMQGILFIVVTVLNEMPLEQLAKTNLTDIFKQLNITQHLTSTRLNGLQQIQVEISKVLEQKS